MELEKFNWTQHHIFISEIEERGYKYVDNPRCYSQDRPYGYVRSGIHARVIPPGHCKPSLIDVPRLVGILRQDANYVWSPNSLGKG